MTITTETTQSHKMPPKIKACDCTNEGQDALHGYKMRAHNPCKNKQGTGTAYRCTVCKKEK